MIFSWTVTAQRLTGVLLACTFALAATGAHAQTFDSQTSPTAPASAQSGESHRLRWTLIGGAAGFGLGFWIGFNKLDDATYAERKIMTVAILSGAGGAVLGNVLGRPRKTVIAPLVGPRVVGVQITRTF